MFQNEREDDSNLPALSNMTSRHIHRLFGMSEELAASFVEKCRARLEAPPDSVRDDAFERGLWLKGCLVLEVCTKEAMPLVSSVMERLHKRALRDVRTSITHDLGACEDEGEWNCSTCSDADKEGFTEDAPVYLDICALDNSGAVSYTHLRAHET